MKKVFTLIMVLCLVFALAACGSRAEEPGAAEEPNATDDAGASGEAVELIMSIGTGQNLKDGAARFKELVEEASGGTIIVTIFPDSVLGDDRVATETTQFGDIDISVCSTSQSAGVYSNLLAFDAPFLFRSTEEVDEIMDGEAAKAILDGMESVGLKGLAYWENGFRNLTNDTREVRVPSDLEGLKIRTMENEVVLRPGRRLARTRRRWPLPRSTPGSSRARSTDRKIPFLSSMQMVCRKSRSTFPLRSISTARLLCL